MKIGAVIVARMRSSRFPGKSLVTIADKPSLAHLLERVRRVAAIQDIVIATTDHVADDVLADFARSQKIACFRGSEDDVMGRVLQAAESIGLDVIVHLTGDCPLMDAELITQVLKIFHSEKVDYAKNFQFGLNANPNLSFPRGLEIEVFKTSALAEVAATTQDPWLREHVTEPLYTWPQFKVTTLVAPKDLARPDLRLCVDTPEDHTLVQAVFENLQKDFSTRDVIAFLDAHPEIRALNKNVQQTKYTAAVIGLGNMGALYDQKSQSEKITTHAGAYKRWSKTRLIAGCDTRAERRDAFQEFYGIDKTYADAEKMLRELKPDVVSIATTPDSHAALLQLCLQHKVRAVFCEKPFVLDGSVGKELLRHVAATQTVVAVNHWMRTTPFFHDVRESIANGFFGEMQKITYHYTKGVWNSGTHAFDLLRFLFGDITAATATHGYDLDTGEKNIDGVLELKSGLQVELITSDYRKHHVTEVLIAGSDARLKIHDGDHFKIELQQGRKHLSAAEFPWRVAKGDDMVRSVANLIDALEGRAPVFCSARDGLAAVMVAEALLRSWANKGEKCRIHS